MKALGPPTLAVPPRSNDGFTLMEVMVALVVLGAGLFLLLEMHYNALHGQNTLQDKVLIRNLMSEAMGMAEVEVTAGNLSGSDNFGRRYPDYTYAFDAEEVGVEFAGLYDVLLTLEGPDGLIEERRFFVMSRQIEGLLTPQGAQLSGENTSGTQGRQGSGAE